MKQALPISQQWLASLSHAKQLVNSPRHPSSTKQHSSGLLLSSRFATNLTHQVSGNSPQTPESLYPLLLVEKIKPLGSLQRRSTPVRVMRERVRQRCGGEVFGICAVDRQFEDRDVVVEGGDEEDLEWKVC